MIIQNIILYPALFLGIYLSFRLLFVQFRVLPKGLKELKTHQNRQILGLGLATLFSVSSIFGIAFAISNGGPGTLVWMFLFTGLAMAIKYVETSLSIRFKKEFSSTIQPSLYDRLSNTPKLKQGAYIAAAIVALGSIGYGAYSQIHLFHFYTDLPVSLPYLSCGIGLILAGITFFTNEKTQRNIISYLTLGLTGFLILFTVGIWLKNQNLAIYTLKFIFTDALSGKAAASGALSATVLTAFIYATLSLQSGFNPINIAYSDTEISPRQAGTLSILEPLFFMLSITLFIASILLFSGNFGSYRYSCNSPFRVGFERTPISALPPGWTLTTKLPADDILLKHHDGHQALECDGSEPMIDSIFLPRMPISTKTGIRFGYYKFKGDMTVTILQESGAPIGQIELNQNNKPIIINKKTRVWLEGPHRSQKWGSYIIRFGDLSDLQLPSNKVMLQFTTTSKDAHWIIDRVEPVEKPELGQMILNSFKTIFPYSSNKIIGFLFGIISFLTGAIWLKQGEIAYLFLVKKQNFIQVYRVIFLTIMVIAPFSTLILPVIALYVGVGILIALNTASIIISIRKFKEESHE